MVVVEIIIVMVVAVVLLTTVISIGRPVAELLASKARFKYDALGSEAEEKLQKRLRLLEEEVLLLRGQMSELKETSEYAVKLLESHEKDKEGAHISLSENVEKQDQKEAQ